MMYAGSPNSGIYKIPVTSPASAVDQLVNNFRFGILRFGHLPLMDFDTARLKKFERGQQEHRQPWDAAHIDARRERCRASCAIFSIMPNCSAMK